MIENFLKELERVLTEDGTDVINAFVDSFEYLQAALEDPGRAKEYLMSTFLSMAKGIALVGFAVLDLVISMLFNIIIWVLELFQIMLNQNLNIPFLSFLYRGITKGRELTALSLFSLKP